MSHQSSSYATFSKEIEQTSSAVDKLKKTFDYMRGCLSAGIGSHRADFWQAKQLSLALFKTAMEPAFRYPLWRQFTEILDSAELANEMISESSAFYLEQFTLALEDLEKKAESEPVEPSFSITETLGFDGTQSALETFVAGLREELFALQGRLEHFRKYAMRYRCLREEIIDCQMNPRDKRALFQRLKIVRGKIFPARDALTERIDALFNEEVTQFVSGALISGEPTKPIYVLKQELKALQNIARALALSSEGFKAARLRLTEFWDLLSAVEDMRKSKLREQRAQSKLSYIEIEGQIEHLRGELEKLSYEELISRIKQIIRFMHTQFLTREDKKELRSQLEALKEPFKGSLQEPLQEPLKAPQPTRKQKEKKAQASAALMELMSSIDALDAGDDAYLDMRSDLEERAGSLNLTGRERELVEARFAALDLARLKMGSGPERERLERRLEALKKEQRGAGLSIERALALDEEIVRIKDALLQQ